MHYLQVLANVFLCCVTSFGQLPVSSLFLVQFDKSITSHLQVTSIEFASGFNPGGYTNQAFFISPERLLVSVRRISDVQTDIYELNLDSHTFKNCSQTQDNEYSPRLFFGSQNLATCVQVPFNDSTIQDLVIMDLSGGEIIKNLTRSKFKIAYYRQINEIHFVCFALLDEHKLCIYNSNTENYRAFASNIGRCFELYDSNTVLFVQKEDSGPYKLRSYSIATQKMDTRAFMPGQIEEFALGPSGEVYAALQSKLLRLKTNGIWEEVADFGSMGIYNISRLAFCDNKIAFINLEKP